MEHDATYDVILDALRSGISLEDIGDSFAKTMNRAQKAYEIEQENKRLAQEQKKNSEMHVRLEKLIAEFLDWLREFKPDLYSALELDEFVAKNDIVDLGDAALSYITTAEHLMNIVNEVSTSSKKESAPSPRTAATKESAKSDTVEDLFNEVFKKVDHSDLYDMATKERDAIVDAINNAFNESNKHLKEITNRGNGADDFTSLVKNFIY